MATFPTLSTGGLVHIQITAKIEALSEIKYKRKQIKTAAAAMTE